VISTDSEGHNTAAEGKKSKRRKLDKRRRQQSQELAAAPPDEALMSSTVMTTSHASSSNTSATGRRNCFPAANLSHENRYITIICGRFFLSFRDWLNFMNDSFNFFFTRNNYGEVTRVGSVFLTTFCFLIIWVLALL
jgi:hypothetical protein